MNNFIKTISTTLILVFLSGCSAELSPQDAIKTEAKEYPEYDPNNPEQWCAATLDAYDSPWMEADRKAILLTMMNNAGCLG